MNESRPTTGKELERRVAAAFREMGAQVKHDINLAGNQIDVYVEFERPGYPPHRIVVEVKDWKGRVGKKQVVNEFADKLYLLFAIDQADEGIIVSRKGFSPSARNAAIAHGIKLVEWEDLETKVERGESWPIPSPRTPSSSPLAGLVRNPQCAKSIRRDDLIEEIKASFSRGNHIVMVVGESGMGKTWLLTKRLPEILGDQYAPLLVEGKVLGLHETLAGFVFEFATQLVDRLREQASNRGAFIALNDPQIQDFRASDWKARFDVFWRGLRSSTGGRKPVFMFDEIENVLEKSDRIDPGIFDFLNGFIGDPRNGYFIIAGSKLMPRLLVRDKLLDCHRQAKLIKVSPYDDDTAKAAFSAIRRLYPYFEKRDWELLVALCDGHPHTIFAVFETIRLRCLLNRQDLSLVELLQEVVEQAEASLWRLYNSQLHPNERIVVQLIGLKLSQVDDRDASALIEALWCSREELYLLAAGKGIRREDVDDGINYLNRRGWIKQRGRKLCLKLSFLPWWLGRCEEILMLMSPMAQNLYT